MSEPDDEAPLGNLDQIPAPSPRDGFADDVMRRIARDERPRRTMPWWATLGLGLAVGAAAALLFVIAGKREETPSYAQPDAPIAVTPESGRLEALERTTLLIGLSATIVAEMGTKLDYDLDSAGNIRVNHADGVAFYRVDRGPMRVETPRGVVEVLGTCFTLDVELGRTDVIVHEGRVMVTAAGDEATIAAGERVRLMRRGLGRVVEREESPPAAADPTTCPACLCVEDMPRFETPPELLQRWADECRINLDTPYVDLTDDLYEEFLQKLDVTPAERPIVLEVYRAMEARADADLRRVYADVTGEDGSDVSMAIVFDEVMRSADVDEYAAFRRKLARERAGLDAPPTDLRRVTPFEEFQRILVRLGDELQRDLGARLGADRALELRRKNQGWPGRGWSEVGCP